MEDKKAERAEQLKREEEAKTERIRRDKVARAEREYERLERSNHEDARLRWEQNRASVEIRLMKEANQLQRDAIIKEHSKIQSVTFQLKQN